MIEHSCFHYHLIDRVDLDIQQLGDFVLGEQLSDQS
jgi:hypothetical protein